MSADLLEQMRRNPLGDWTISDVEKVCRAYGLWFRAGSGTSHCMPNILSQSNIDHSGSPADQAGLHSQTCALY
jgi:hypothetical protein